MKLKQLKAIDCEMIEEVINEIRETKLKTYDVELRRLTTVWLEQLERAVNLEEYV